MDTEALEKYEKWHTDFDQIGDDPALMPWHIMARDVLRDFDFRGKKVLEIACGRGGFSYWLAQQGAEVVAADFSPAAVKATKLRLSTFPASRAEQQDLERLAYPESSFDLVICLETLEHLPSPKRGMQELVRVTKAGGTLVITGPNYFGITGLYRIYRRLIGRPYTEAGQPINQLLFLLLQVRRLAALHCKIEESPALVTISTSLATIRVGYSCSIDFRCSQKWFALHGMISATRR